MLEESPRPVSILRHEAPVSDVEFYDDQLVLTGTKDGQVTVWEDAIGRRRETITGEGSVMSVQVCMEQESDIYLQRKDGLDVFVERWNIPSGSRCFTVLTGSESFAPILQPCVGR